MPDANPSKRYFELVRQLGNAYGRPRHGWKSRVARALGVHPSFVSKIDAGKVSTVGVDMIERAVQAAGVPREWFFDANLPLTVTLDIQPASLDDLQRRTVGQTVANPFNAEQMQRAARDVLHEVSLGGLLPETARRLAHVILSAPLVREAMLLESATNPDDLRNHAVILAAFVVAGLSSGGRGAPSGTDNPAP